MNLFQGRDVSRALTRFPATFVPRASPCITYLVCSRARHMARYCCENGKQLVLCMHGAPKKCGTTKAGVTPSKTRHPAASIQGRTPRLASSVLVWPLCAGFQQLFLALSPPLGLADTLGDLDAEISLTFAHRRGVGSIILTESGERHENRRTLISYKQGGGDVSWKEKSSRAAATTSRGNDEPQP